MMEHSSEMPSSDQDWPWNGTNPAKSAWEEFTGSSGVNQGMEEILKEDLGSAHLQNPWAECWEADSAHC